MKKKSVLYVLTVLLVAGLFAGGYWTVQRPSDATCGICQRHINKRARVVAEIGGRRRDVCCAHCARTEGQQENKPVRLIEVTDYVTGQSLNPQEAWYVDGSRVVACEHKMTRTDEMKQPGQLVFDRCSPGTFAFRDRTAAEAFAAENGGVVLGMAQFLGEVQSK